MRYAFLSHFSPNACGHGGEHRSYQIAYELGKFTHQEFTAIYDIRLKRACPPVPHRPLGERVLTKLTRLIKPPVQKRKPVHAESDCARHPGLLRPNDDSIRKRIRDLITASDERITLLIEHPGFVALIPSDLRPQVRVLCLPQNMETIDAIVPDTRRPSKLLDEAEFSEELDALAQVDDRLVISFVEAGLLNSIGLPAEVYPYRPVGEIRAFGVRLRSERTPEVGRFVLLGSSTHHTTREGMEWFFGELINDPLPQKICIDVVGSGTDALVSRLAPGHPNIRGLGFVPDDILYGMLSRATAVLAPQFRGMGTLTKLSELSLAGVPCVTGTHAQYPLDVPPGVCGLPMRWAPWRQRLLCDATFAFPDTAAYERWESRQAGLGDLLRLALPAKSVH